MPWYKMFFDERPKTTRRDLYDMDEQLHALFSALKRGDPMVLILGLRRTGKTSLLLTGLGEAEAPAIVVDLRAIAEKPYATKKDLLSLLEAAVNKFLAEQKGRGRRLLDSLKRVKGIQVVGTGITFAWGGRESLEVAELFTQLNESASRDRFRLVVAFDEAQDLAKVAGLDMSRVLAHVYDYCSNITMVLTGSAIGLLHDFIGTEDPKAPLYGRGRTEIVLRRLNQSEVREFLETGFRQLKLRPNDEVLGTAISKLDGIIGWLTLFGSICMKEGVSEYAIERVRQAAVALTKREFQNFLAARLIARKRYVRIMKHLAQGPATWSSIKRAVEATEGRTINDRNITELITTLLKASFVEKTDGFYRIGDPMLAEAFR